MKCITKFMRITLIASFGLLFLQSCTEEKVPPMDDLVAGANQPEDCSSGCQIGELQNDIPVITINRDSIHEWFNDSIFDTGWYARGAEIDWDDVTEEAYLIVYADSGSYETVAWADLEFDDGDFWVCPTYPIRDCKYNRDCSWTGCELKADKSGCKCEELSAPAGKECEKTVATLMFAALMIEIPSQNGNSDIG